MIDMAKKKTLDERFNDLSDKHSNLINSEEYKLLQKLKKKGINTDDVMSVVNAAERGNRNATRSYSIATDHFKFLVFGDTHIGHKKYDARLMNTAAKEAKKQKVDAVLCTGDIADGWYQNRPAAIFEQDAIGFDNQLEKSVKEFSKLGNLNKPIYYITGNHEYNTFVRGAGVEFGNIFKLRLDKLGIENYYMGNGEANLKLETGSTIKLLHPDGGSSYAISYKSQKIIESLQGAGEKLPSVALIGHFHKSEYIPYQGVNVLQTGTFCGQTKFMRGKGLAAHKGFWIVDLYSKKNGTVDKIIPQYYSGK
jgi:predicted phosphodiesterase